MPVVAGRTEIPVLISVTDVGDGVIHKGTVAETLDALFEEDALGTVLVGRVEAYQVTRSCEVLSLGPTRDCTG